MAIRFKFHGMPFRCDSASEAAELISALNSSGAKPLNGYVAPKEPIAGQHHKGDFTTFWHSADEPGRKMLVAVATSPVPVIAESLVSQLNVRDVLAVAWVRRKLNITAEKSGIHLAKFLSQEKVQVDGRPKTAYRATNKLIDAMKSVSEAEV